MDRFILDESGNIPVPVADLTEWAKWHATNRALTRVDLTQISADIKVSTVFLGLDHGYGQSSPLLWESIVFGGDLDQHMDRCSGNRADAQEMHKRMVDTVCNVLKEKHE